MALKQGDNLSQENNAELAEGLRLLENSQSMLRTLFLGLALQYRSLDIQRCQLLQVEDSELCCGELPPLVVQNAASLIILCALFGFQKQAEALAQQSEQAGECPDLLSVKLGAVSILIALIRLVQLNFTVEAAASPAGEEEYLLSNDSADLPL